FGGITVTDADPDYGVVSDVQALGRIARGHRKRRRLTLETVSGPENLSPRFLSEFERGKETAEIGKVLKALSLLGICFSEHHKSLNRRLKAHGKDQCTTESATLRGGAGRETPGQKICVSRGYGGI
ncbi:MAG: hypothetical protein ACP5GA_02575, partial [Acidithiobacillus sp.]